MTQHDQGYELLCEEVREALSGALDLGTGAIGDDAVTRHLGGCAACAAFQRELLELDDILKIEEGAIVDKARVWARVQAEIDASSPTVSLPVTPPLGYASRRMVLRWASAAIVIGAVPLGFIHWPRDNGRGSAFISEIARDFRAYRESGKHLDVATTHPAILRSWMAARVEFDLPKDVAGPVGVRLAGGRLCAILGEKLAFFAYDTAVGPVGLYVTPSRGLTNMEADRIAATALDEGLTTIAWRRGDLGYVVVASASIGKLDPFVHHFREGTA